MSGLVGSRLNIRGSGIIGGIGTDGQVLTSSGAGQEIVFEDAAGGVDGITDNSNANAITIDSGENVAIDSGNLVISTSGKGVDFSAQTATSASGAITGRETLDHYEVGTWTPTWVIGTSGSVTNSGQLGHYHRIGNLVVLYWYLARGASVSSPIGDISVGGLPFTPSGEYGPSSVFRGQAWISGAGLWGGNPGIQVPVGGTARTTGIVLYTLKQYSTTYCGPFSTMQAEDGYFAAGDTNYNQTYGGAAYFCGTAL